MSVFSSSKCVEHKKELTSGSGHVSCSQQTCEELAFRGGVWHGLQLWASPSLLKTCPHVLPWALLCRVRGLQLEKNGGLPVISTVPLIALAQLLLLPRVTKMSPRALHQPSRAKCGPCEAPGSNPRQTQESFVSFRHGFRNASRVRFPAGRPRIFAVPDDAAGRRVFSGISRFPRPCIPVPLHAHFASPLSVLKISMLRAAQISSLTLRKKQFSVGTRRQVLRSQRGRSTRYSLYAGSSVGADARSEETLFPPKDNIPCHMKGRGEREEIPARGQSYDCQPDKRIVRILITVYLLETKCVWSRISTSASHTADRVFDSGRLRSSGFSSLIYSNADAVPKWDLSYPSSVRQRSWLALFHYNYS
ncbi:hypothetical protein PR048_004995, partial [Dryococelus australis]